MRAEVQVVKLEKAVAPIDDPMVQVTAKTGQLDDVEATVAWMESAPQAPRYADRYTVRVDWIDPSADDPTGVALEDEARRWIREHPEQAVRIAGGDVDAVVRALEGEWGTRGTILAMLAPLTAARRLEVLDVVRAEVER